MVHCRRPARPAGGRRVSSGLVLTFGELAGRAHQVVHGLRAAASKRTTSSPTRSPTAPTCCGGSSPCRSQGCTPIALNPSLSAGEVGTVLEHSGAAAVVVDHQFADPSHPRRARPGITLKSSVGGAIEGFETYEDLVAGSADDGQTTGRSVPRSSTQWHDRPPKAISRANVPGDPSVITDQMKLFGRAFQFRPLEGCHLVSTAMYHGGATASTWVR